MYLMLTVESSGYMNRCTWNAFRCHSSSHYLPYRIFSSAILPSTPNLSAMALMRSGRKVPGMLSIWVWNKAQAVSTLCVNVSDLKIDEKREWAVSRDLMHLSGSTTEIRGQLSHNTHCMCHLCLASTELPINYPCVSQHKIPQVSGIPSVIDCDMRPPVAVDR